MGLSFLALAGFITGCVCAFIYENAITKIAKRKKLIIHGYKLHHSLYGILLILVSLLVSFNFEIRIILMFAGIGVIFEHYLTGGGLDFITKDIR